MAWTWLAKYLSSWVKCIYCFNIFYSCVRHLGVGTKLLTGIGVSGLRFEGGLFSETDFHGHCWFWECRWLSSFFYITISISGSGDVGESVLCLIWIFSLSGWYIHLFEGLDVTSLSIGVVDVLIGDKALSASSFLHQKRSLHLIF